MNQIGECEDDFETELAATQHAGDDTILFLGATKDAISDEHGRAEPNAPDQPDVRESAPVRIDALGKDILGIVGELEFLLVGNPTTALFLGFLAFLFLFAATSLFPLFFGLDRVGFVDFGGSTAELLAQVDDFLLRRRILLLKLFDALLLLSVIGTKQIDEPIEIDAAFAQIVFEVSGVHPQSVGSRGSTSCARLLELFRQRIDAHLTKARPQIVLPRTPNAMRATLSRSVQPGP